MRQVKAGRWKRDAFGNLYQEQIEVDLGPSSARAVRRDGAVQVGKARSTKRVSREPKQHKPWVGTASYSRELRAHPLDNATADGVRFFKKAQAKGRKRRLASEGMADSEEAA